MKIPSVAFFLRTCCLLLPTPHTMASAEEEELGMFVRRRWRNLTSATENSFCDASSCDSRMDDGCLPLLSIRLENVCYRSSGSSIEKIRASSFLEAINDTHYCEVEYLDADCQVPSYNGTECRNPWSSEECPSDDPSLTEMLYYPNFCIESTSPKGEFVYPMHESRIYGNETACSDDSDVYINSYIPIGPVCIVTAGGVKDDQRLLTSSSRTCLPDGRTQYKRYTDMTCSEQEDGFLDFPPLTWTDGCNSPQDALEGANTNIEYRQTTDCSTPRYYCKDFSGIEFFSIMENTPGDGTSWAVTGRDETSVIPAIISSWFLAAFFWRMI